MVQPIDYLGMMQRPDLGESLIGGLKTGLAIREVRDTQAAQEAAKAKQAQYAADLQQYLDNPTAGGAAAMTAKYPDQAKALKQSWELNSQEQKDSLFNDGTRAYSAIQSGRPEIAEQIISDRIAALENSGQDASAFKSIRDSLKSNPQSALASIGMTLANAEPDKWGKIAGEMRAAEQAPFELTKKQADAHKAAVDARFAESAAVQDLEKRGWEITKLQNDISVQNLNKKIAVLDANIKREDNQRKRDEMQMKRDEAAAKREETVRLKADEAQTGADTINTISAQIGEILGDEDTLRAATGLGAFRGAIPGTEARALSGRIAQLQDTLAAANLDKLKGPMSDKDIAFVRSLGSNLDRYQDEDKFISELKRLNDLLPGTMDKLNSKYGSSFTLQKNEPAIEDNTGAPPAGAVRRVR